MGLNRFISLSKSSVLPEVKSVNAKSSKIAVKKPPDCENRKKKYKVKEASADISSQKIDKTVKNVRIATTTKKSMIWNTLRITNKDKSCVNKGKVSLIGFLTGKACQLTMFVSISSKLLMEFGEFSLLLSSINR